MTKFTRKEGIQRRTADVPTMKGGITEVWGRAGQPSSTAQGALGRPGVGAKERKEWEEQGAKGCSHCLHGHAKLTMPLVLHINLTPSRVTWEEILNEELSRSDWSVCMSVGDCLNCKLNVGGTTSRAGS